MLLPGIQCCEEKRENIIMCGLCLYLANWALWYCVIDTLIVENFIELKQCCVGRLLMEEKGVVRDCK